MEKLAKIQERISSNFIVCDDEKYQYTCNKMSKARLVTWGISCTWKSNKSTVNKLKVIL